MAHCIYDGSILESRTVSGPPQEQPASAHISAPHKIQRELQTLPECSDQDVDVLFRADAAKQHSFAAGAQFGGQFERIPFDGLAIAWILVIDVHARQCSQFVDREWSL